MFCFSAFCFPLLLSSAFLCFCASLLFRFSCFSAFLLLCCCFSDCLLGFSLVLSFCLQLFPALVFIIIIFGFSAFAFLCFCFRLLFCFSTFLLLCFSASLASLVFCFSDCLLRFYLFEFSLAALHCFVCLFFLVDCFPLLPLLFFAFLLLCFSASPLLCFNALLSYYTVAFPLSQRMKASSPTRKRRSLAKSPSKPSSKRRCKWGGCAALLSREEMNRHVFSNTREGESHTKTLQGVESEEHRRMMNETSSPTDKKAKARHIRWGVKKQENKVK